MTKRNILSVLFAGLLAGSCSGPEVRLEKINPYAVPQISIEEEALADLPDLIRSSLHLLNDTLLCLLNQQDASSIRIFQTTGKEMNQYTLKKKGHRHRHISRQEFTGPARISEPGQQRLLRTRCRPRRNVDRRFHPPAVR